MVRLPLLTLRGKYTTVVRSMVTSTIYHGEQVRTADCMTSAAAHDASVKNTCKRINGGLTKFLGSLKTSLCEEIRLKDTQNLKCKDRRLLKWPSFEV